MAWMKACSIQMRGECDYLPCADIVEACTSNTHVLYRNHVQVFIRILPLLHDECIAKGPNTSVLTPSTSSRDGLHNPSVQLTILLRHDRISRAKS